MPRLWQQCNGHMVDSKRILNFQVTPIRCTVSVCHKVDAADEKKPGPFIVVLIFTLALITVALVWVLLVKLMALGILKKSQPADLLR